MRTVRVAKNEGARARRRRIAGTKTKKAVLVGAAVATAVSVGLAPPIANAVASETYVIGLPSWLPADLVGGVPTLPSDPKAINNAVVGVKDNNPLIAWGATPVNAAAPAWQTWYNPSTMSFGYSRTGTGLFGIPLFSGGWTTTTWGQWVSPTDLTSADPLAIVAYVAGGGDLAQALAPLVNWTAYLQNVNLIAYGDGAIAAGQAYQALVDNFKGQTPEGYDPVTVGDPLTGPRQIVIVGANDPTGRTTQSQTFSNIIELATAAYALNIPGIGHQVPMPNPTAQPDLEVTPGGVIDATLLSLILLRNPGRPGGGLYSQFAPIYQEITGTNPVTPDRQDVLPDGVDPELVAKLLRGEPIDDISLETLIAALENADGQPILITIKADATWEYDLLSDAPLTANPVAWANSAASSLLVFNLLGGLLELGSGAVDPADPPIGVKTYVAPDGTIYATLTQSQLPLLAPFRLPAQLFGLVTGEDINTPGADAIEPLLKVLTNIAYADVVRNVDPVTGEITYDRTHLEHHVQTLFGTQTLDRETALYLPGDLISVLGKGVGDEMTDVLERTLVRVVELLNEIGIEAEVAPEVAQLLRVPGDAITTVSRDVGDGVSQALAAIGPHLPESPFDRSQEALAQRQRAVGKVVAPVIQTAGQIGAGVTAAVEGAGAAIQGPVPDEGAPLALTAADDEPNAGVAKTAKRSIFGGGELREGVSELRAKVKADATERRAATKKAVSNVRAGVKQAGDNIKKSVKDTTEKLKKAVTPKPKAEKKSTADE
ncbi:PE-PPE domain-containing protein [[Mycobacterium] burgundiense]|uniref:PE-PPE domain-containing protein n=1 Tax=[Mycobacterium] burgundiense TaxID=3064286 RepID=A0ABN9NPV1_9MYCO|nr:PE-PPE domain-containing protein [Mycolicibacterium sp. MU0053]CAJ1510142.1 PE-PPE domain-containing protein [Mycolicibacterium sp. MU0053]